VTATARRPPGQWGGEAAPDVFSFACQRQLKSDQLAASEN
jgi:hypothetical protein